MEALLNFDVPLDIPFLDRVVEILSSGAPPEIRHAQAVLTKFQEHPDAWQRVDKILTKSASLHTKFFGLQILEGVINTRWKILPEEQRLGIREFVVNFVIELSREEQGLRSQKVLINKLNHTLVQVLKQDWPHAWPNFVSDLVGSSKTSDALCENNMNILRCLSEEVFDFSSGKMTSHKIKTLKETLNSEFALVFELCQHVLQTSQNTALLVETLQTLLKFLSWIPLGYIFETKMIEILGGRFLPVKAFRNHALRCLTEIGGLETPSGQYNDAFVSLFHGVMEQLTSILPLPPTEEGSAHYAIYIPKQFDEGTEEDENFIANLGLFFTGFFRAHLHLVESNPATAGRVLVAHKYLIGISNVDRKEIFKSCLEYWLWLSEDVYVAWRGSQNFISGAVPTNNARKTAYSQIFSDCRRTTIKKMVKPEEVIIIEDENGDLVKEWMPDVDTQQLYWSMRELLVFLTHLDYDDTETIMLDKLASQVDRSEWSWKNLNTLCWAIGSITGSMTEEDEKRFLVAVVKDLLGLCEMMRGKENKAVIASNIMYVVGQYPRFLKAHWKFLKTVVNKLHEFMHESFPGIQEMSVDTFLKISKQCKDKFVAVQPTDTQPFLTELLTNLSTMIADLEPVHAHVIFESLAWMIGVADPQNREELLHQLMAIPNGEYHQIITSAQQNVDTLRSNPTMKNLTNILKVNVRVCKAIGHWYTTQLVAMYGPMMEVYKIYSGMITQEVAQHGTMGAKHTHVRYMRCIKREILKLIQGFVEKTDDPDAVQANLIPPLLDAILTDYHTSCPDARDACVLSLLSAVVSKLKGRMVTDVAKILEATLEVTLQMITKNFEDAPEHRIHFFKMLQNLNTHCFPSFLAAVQQSKAIMDSIVWAFKHTERNIANTGLSILLQFFQNVSQSEVATPFYQAYYLSLLNDVFVVLTDTLHKTGFKLQCQILQHMMSVVGGGKITGPLSPQQTADNVAFVKEYLINLLGTFPNLQKRQIEVFVDGMFELKADLKVFKAHMRDFLVQLKEFSGEDNAELYDDERDHELRRKKEEISHRLLAIPGLEAPVLPNKKEEIDMLD